MKGQMTIEFSMEGNTLVWGDIVVEGVQWSTSAIRRLLVGVCGLLDGKCTDLNFYAAVTNGRADAEVVICKVCAAEGLRCE